jgi:hypothetical protein
MPGILWGGTKGYKVTEAIGGLKIGFVFCKHFLSDRAYIIQAIPAGIAFTLKLKAL